MESEYIKSLLLDEGFAKYRSVKELDTAVNDLLSYNYFSVINEKGQDKLGGPYDVVIDMAENRLILNIKLKGKAKPVRVLVPMRSFRSIIKDYFIVCESYQEMLKKGMLEKVEAIDMGRRSVHNEGAEIFLHLLENKINMDFETARRLFTIITVLHM